MDEKFFCGRIESADNTKIKLATRLHLKKYRDAENAFVAEGIRLAETAAASPWRIRFALCADSATKVERARRLLQKLADKKCATYAVPDRLYRKISATDSPQGIMLVVERKIFRLDDLPREKNNSLFVVLDGVSDPGNVGTIIRTADSFGAAAVIALNGTADIFADKTVRASMGSLFHLPTVQGITVKDAMSFFARRDIFVFATALDAKAKKVFDADFRKAAAVVFGSEADGVSKELLDAAQKIYIPMRGKAESLNVASAAAAILYEAARQKLK